MEGHEKEILRQNQTNIISDLEPRHLLSHLFQGDILTGEFYNPITHFIRVTLLGLKSIPIDNRLIQINDGLIPINDRLIWIKDGLL